MSDKESEDKEENETTIENDALDVKEIICKNELLLHRLKKQKKIKSSCGKRFKS